jgi:hypothetical protein
LAEMKLIILLRALRSRAGGVAQGMRGGLSILAANRTLAGRARAARRLAGAAITRRGGHRVAAVAAAA